ncbi:MAG: undecaprenyl-diphosphate phosphatase [Rhodothermales bacterium]
MSWWEAALLGLIQGLTEFLPVSSSGHLVLAQHLLGLEASGITFEVFVHFGTVLSIVTVYRHRIVELLAGAWAGLIRPAKIPEYYREKADFRFSVFILITMVPTGLIYVLIDEQLESAFGSPRLTCAMLLVTGTLLLLTLLRKDPEGPLTPLKSLVIGTAQAAALIPGISRSGSTICTALYQNVTPEKAANFSFLMSLPVIVGATGIEALKLWDVGLSGRLLPILIGTAIAYVAGIAAIRIVLDFVRRGNLSYFAYYCFALGGLGLLLL